MYTKGGIMKISILANNESKSGFENEHGLSIYIQHKLYNILFDVGYTDVYLKNADKLNVDLNETEYIILSHGHYDHTGGLRFFKPFKALQSIYIHKDAFKNKYAKEKKIRYNGIPFKENEIVWLKNYAIKIENYNKINTNFYLLSNISHQNINKKYYVDDRIDDFHDETILILEEAGELSLFMGCSHFGVINGVLAVQEIFPNKKIKNLVAGMHLSTKTLDEIKEIGEKLFSMGIEMIYPLHCTGRTAIEYFSKKYKHACTRLYAGDQIEI